MPEIRWVLIEDALLLLNCTTLEQAAVKIGHNKQSLPADAKKPNLKPYEEGLFRLVTQGVPEKELHQKLGIDKRATHKTIQSLIKRANVATYYELIVIANH